MPVQIVIERSRLSDLETLGEKCNGRNINIHAIVCQSYIARDTCPFTPMQSTDLSGWNILPVLNRKANRPNNPINTVSTKSVTESDKQAAGISPFGQMCVGPRPRFRRGEVWTQKLKSHLLRTQSLKVFPLKPTVSQYIAIHATLTARDFFLISTLPIPVYARRIKQVTLPDAGSRVECSRIINRFQNMLLCFWFRVPKLRILPEL